MTRKRTFLLPLAVLVSVISPTALANLPEQQYTVTQANGQENNKLNFSFIIQRSGQTQYFARHASHSSHASHASHSSHYSSSSSVYPSTPTPTPTTGSNVNQPPAEVSVPQDAAGVFNGIPIYDMKKK